MTFTDFTIRAYEPRDLKPLSQIWHDAAKRAHPFLGAQRLLAQRKMIEEIYLPQAETWVACVAHEPVGFIGLVNGFVGGLFIAPTHQGLGIGRALIAHARTLKGDLTLEVYTDNQKAYGFYQNLGFIEIARRAKDDNDLPFENARMRLKAFESA